MKKTILAVVVTALYGCDGHSNDMNFTPQQPAQKEVTYNNIADCLKDLGHQLCGVEKSIADDILAKEKQQVASNLLPNPQSSNAVTAKNTTCNPNNVIGNPTEVCEPQSSSGTYVYRGDGGYYSGVNGNLLSEPARSSWQNTSNSYALPSNATNSQFATQKPITVIVPANTVTSRAISTRVMSSGAITRGGFGGTGIARGGSAVS